MKTPTSVGDGGRYRIEGEIGRGGMGVVYRAIDKNTGQYRAVKFVQDVSNPEGMARFDQEWRILAELEHTNIVGITDRGVFRDGSITYPYFVMPFLRGKTLLERISGDRGPLTVAEVANVVSAVAAGLQAAHNKGLVHRDVKPSNIFILDNGAVVVIDFGVVHLGEKGTVTTMKGTTPYIAPELLDPQKHDKPSPQSDLFALGVVCYEALTRVQPFARPTVNETVRAILQEIPKPAYELNRNVSIAVGQVVQKAMAKNKGHRYRTVTEFAEKLQKASRGEPLPEFDRRIIDDRLRIVRDALSRGQTTSAHEMLRGIEEEGYVEDSITELRQKIDQARQRDWIRAQLESVRLYREAKEYGIALEKVSAVLELAPDNPDALAERDLIDQGRFAQALSDARNHIEKHEFGEARKWIDEARQIRLRDTVAGELLREVARLEETDRALADQKEALYQEARSAHSEGYLRAALQRLERVVELIRGADPTQQSERDAVYLRLYDEVLQEHSRVAKASETAKEHLAGGQLPQALAICDEMLSQNPGHSLFQGIKLQIENRRRELRLDYLQNVRAQLRQIADLDRRVALLQDAVNAYPDEAELVDLLRHAKESRDLVNSLMAKARVAEGSGEYGEALDRWRIVKEVHPAQPGVQFEIARVEKRFEEQVLASQKSIYTEEIWRLLRAAEYSRALALCGSALEAFPQDGELLALQSDAQERMKRGSEVKTLLEEAQASLHDGKTRAALEILRRAFDLDRNDPQTRQVLGIALLDHARSLPETDLAGTERLLEEAQTLIPNDPAVRDLTLLVADRKRRERVELTLARARRLRLAGDLRGAIREIDECLTEYPNDRRLLAERQRLQQELGENIPTPVAPRSPFPAKSPEKRTPSDNQREVQAVTAPTDTLFPPMDETVTVPNAQQAAAVAGGGSTGGSASATQNVGPALPAQTEPPARPSAPRVSPAAGRKLWSRAAGIWSQFRAALGSLLTRLMPKPLAARGATKQWLLAGAGALVLVAGGAYAAYKIIGQGRKSPPPLTTVEITTTPPGAQIEIDDAPRGASPLRVDLDPGQQHKISASLRGYQTAPVTPVEVQGKSMPFHLELQPIPLTLRLVTDQSSGNVQLDENPASELNGNQATFPSILPGSHTLRFEGAFKASADFNFSAGELPAAGELPNGSQPVILFIGDYDGRMRVQCNCAPATLMIDGQDMPLPDTGLDIPDVKEGDHPIELTPAKGRKETLTFTAARDPALTIGFYGGPSKPPAPPPPPVPELIGRAKTLIGQGNYAEADKLVGQILKRPELREPDRQEAEGLKVRLGRFCRMFPWPGCSQ